MEECREAKDSMFAIQIIRNIALLTVILGHAGCIYAGKWRFEIVNQNSYIIKYFTEYLYSFHMPLFVFISGYVYNYNRKRLNKYNSYKCFIYNKYKRLIIPYILTGTLFMIPIQKVFNVYSDNESYIYKVVHGILLGKETDHLWYLLMLFNLFIIFRLIENKLGTNYKLNIIIISLISVFSVLIHNFYQIQSSFKYLIYFYIGYIFSENIEIISSNLKSNRVKFLIIHLLLFNFKYLILDRFGINIIYIKVVNLILKQLIAILAICGILGIFLDILYSDKVTKLCSNKIYFSINKYNFYIYLFHQPIMLSIISAVRNIDIRPMFLYSILCILTLVISISISNGIMTLKSIRKNKKVIISENR